MNLPEKNPYTMQFLLDDKIMKNVSQEVCNEIMRFDPYYNQRIVLKNIIIERVLCILWPLKVKFEVLNAVLPPQGDCCEIILYNLLEDAAKQCVTSLAELLGIFCEILDLCQGQYSTLFKKGAQRKLIDALINGNVEKEQNYVQLSEMIDVKREIHFSRFNAKGIPSNESFQDLKDKIIAYREPVKKYRDKVAAHADKDCFYLSFSDLNQSFESFQQLVLDIYTISTFEHGFADPLINGQSSVKISNELNKILWQ